MRLTILAVGRLSEGPERRLVQDYLERATSSGRAVGLGPVDLVEVEPRKAGKPGEAEALFGALAESPRGVAKTIACDERGLSLPSRSFAARIGAFRDDGVKRVTFLIGGADGLAQEVLDQADERLGFGVQTWPHALARVMLSEQLYRAMTILTNGPYHRD